MSNADRSKQRKGNSNGTNLVFALHHQNCMQEMHANFSMHQNLDVGFLTQLGERRHGVGKPRIHTSKKFSGDAKAAGSRMTI